MALGNVLTMLNSDNQTNIGNIGMFRLIYGNAKSVHCLWRSKIDGNLDSNSNE